MTQPTDLERPDEPRRGRWSYEEVERFKELWGLRDEVALAREFDRPVASLRKLARKLFDGTRRKGPWSADEVQRLKRYLGASRLQIVAQVLGRTVEDVRTKLAQLAVDVSDDPLVGEERLDFKRLYGTRADEDLAIIFARRLDLVRRTGAELCLSKDKAFVRRESRGKETTRMPRWTEPELQRLRELYPGTSNLEIARLLQRSVKSVVSKAHHLGLHKDLTRLQEMGRENVAIRHQRRDGGDSGAGGAELETDE